MAKLAIYSPADPFIQHAADRYCAKNGNIESVGQLPSIKAVFRAVGDSCDYGLVPIENMIDGHSVPVLELLLQSSNVTIIDELIIPATFGLVSTVQSNREITELLLPFTAKNDCSEFLATLPGATLLPISSVNEIAPALAAKSTAASLIPTWMIKNDAYPRIIPNVSDYSGNSTRYLVLAAQEQPFEEPKKYKTSIVLLETVDKPGVLSEILTAFSSRGINLTSIISRPTREYFGTYHFFIDCLGYILAADLQAALTEIKKWGHIKLLGSYPAAELTPEAVQPSRADSIPSMVVNPFRNAGNKSNISIGAGNGPYRNTLDALTAFNLLVVKGKRVLLKPNIGRIAEPSSGVVTNPQVIAAAIDAFRAAGAEVAIGESPITGVAMDQAYEKSGVSFIAHERNCPLIDMDVRPPVEIAVRDGAVIRSLKVCADIFDFDIIVSMPVMKTHMHTVVTLSVKNMKGCLWRRSKVDLHMLPRLPFSDDKSLNIAIADMASVVRPHLVIIDGTVGMEGLGPSSGESKPLDLVIVGNDAFAADTVGCTIMGIAPASVPHLRIAAERGYCTLDLNDITITNPDWLSLCRQFAPVPKNLTMQFPRVKILDEQSCSACQSTVLLFMKRYGDRLGDYFPDNKPITIAIGKGHKGVPPNTICIGNCTRRFKDAGVYIPGCPPVASSILAELEKQKTRNTP